MNAPQVTRLLPKTRLTFSNVDDDSSEVVVLHRYVQVLGIGDGSLEVKVHDATIPSGAPTAASVLIEAKTTCPSIEDPDVDFVGETVSEVTLEAGITGPTLRTARLRSNFGAYLRIELTANQATTAATFEVTISIDLVGRPGIAPKPQLDGDLELDSASPTLEVGDGTGSPVTIIDKVSTGTGRLEFEDDGVDRWAIEADASEDFNVHRYNSSGVLQDSATADGSNGDWGFPKRVTVSGGDVADADSKSDDLVIGDGSSDAGVTVVASTSSEAAFTVAETASPTEAVAQWRYELSSNQWVCRIGNADELVATNSALRPNSDAGMSLGTSSQHWNDLYVDDAFIGDGNGSIDVTMDKGSTGSCYFNLLSNGVKRWEVGQDTGEDFLVKRYSSGGSELNDAIRVDSSDGTVLTHGLRYTFHAYDRTNDDKCYIPMNTVSESTSLSSTANSAGWIAPFDGELYKVYVRFRSNGGSTDVGFHKNWSSSTVAEVTESVGSGTSVEFDFTGENATFSAGDVLSVSVEPANTPNDVNVTCVWKYEEEPV